MADLETRIRITAQLGQTVSELRKLKRELDDLDKAAATSPSAPAGPSQAILANRAEVAERKRLAKEAAATEKAAAAEALAAQRAAANQARQLGPQLTDIFVGLSTGQSPFVVLLQQGGQLKDVFGGIGNAAKALASVFTPLRVIVGGVAAAIAGVAVAALQGARESDALNKSLALTGNIAGTSLGQLNTLAKDIAAGQNSAIGNVRDVLAGLVATGTLTQTSLAATGRAVTALQKLTGASAEDAIKAFDGQADGVTQWAVKANRAYNFLNATQIAYIRTLQSQGREQEAIKFVNEELAKTLESRTAPVLGTIEKLWQGIAKWTRDAWDAAKDYGRDSTPEEKVAKLRKEFDALQASRDGAARGGRRKSTTDTLLADKQAEVEAAEEVLRLAQRSADQKAAIAQKNQKEIEQGAKQYQDSIAAVDAAGAQRALAEQQKLLDARQAAVEKSNAAGVLSEKAYALALNSIDQQRLTAQAATLQKQIEIESRSRGDEKPEQALARNAAVQQLQAQLIGIRSQIATAQAGAVNIVIADGLKDAREGAQQYEQVMRTAITAVRTFAQQNAESTARALVDPIARAAAEAEAKTADMRRQFTEAQRDLGLRLSVTLDEGQRAELVKQIQALSAEAGAAIGEAARSANFDSLRTQFSNLADTVATKERDLDAAVARGVTTTSAAERQKLEARRAQLPVLQAIIDKLDAIASRSPEEQKSLEEAKKRLGELGNQEGELSRTFRTSVGGGSSQVFVDIASGAETALGSVKKFIGTIASSMLDVVSKRLGNQLLESLLPSGGAASGSFLASIGTFFAGLFHTGGVVGAGGGAGRSVDPRVFAFAPRYHSGGIAGLRANEVPAILMAGEEVLTADDPRHRKNGGGAGGASVSIQVNVTGAQGSGAQQRAGGDELGSMLSAAVQKEIDVWATRQSRSGGLLAGRS